MRLLRHFVLLLCTTVPFLPAPAQAQSLFSPWELEALLAPVALYPNEVISQVLGAAVDPARRDLLPYPELRERMAESPDWAQDLGYAYSLQPGEVWRAIRLLRERAAAAGYGMVPLQYVAARVYYVPYYNPVIVYGPVWRPVRPLHWRPWTGPVASAPSSIAQASSSTTRSTFSNGPPSPAARLQNANSAAFTQRARQADRPSRALEFQQQRLPRVEPFHNVPESQRHPIVEQPGPRPAHQHGNEENRGQNRDRGARGRS